MLCSSSMHNPESCVTLLLPKEPVNRKDLIVSQPSQHQVWAPRMALWEPPPITQTDGHGPKVQGPSCLTLVKCSRLGQEQNSSCICLTVVCLRGSAADKWHKLPCKTDPLTLAAQTQWTLWSHWPLSLSPELGCARSGPAKGHCRRQWLQCSPAASHFLNHMTGYFVLFLFSRAVSQVLTEPRDYF